MSKRKKFQEKGSALLVVLGFLTFMMISAVSFSIYMRTERQASSNYRHSLTARHLLESALYRAIDEVDADLRTAAEKKFPTHWNGRVFTSKTNVPEVEDARVLSLEALSFLPPSLVNDARFHSMGTQWRRMSMPIESSVDIENNRVQSSGGKSFIGRYAYICVNMSDMLNINGCTNAIRGVSNLVSVASLFADDNSQLIDWTKAEAFSKQASKDVYYGTLQDFYACMVEQPYFTDPSPYIQFLKGEGNVVFNDAKKHLLVADGFAKARPWDPKAACNLGEVDGQPLTQTTLAGSGTVDSQLQSKFRTVALTLPQANQKYVDSVLPGVLADYLSEDSKEARGLDVPSVKLGPMICQFLLTQLLSSEVRRRVEVVGNKNQTVVELQLFSDLIYTDPSVRNLSLQMRVCYPFKNVSADRRARKYKIKVTGFVRVVPNRNDKRPTSADLGKGVDFPFDGSGTMDASTIPTSPKEDDCYVTVKLDELKGPAFDTKQLVKMLVIDENGIVKPQGEFKVGDKFSVVLAISSAQVFNPENKLIDSVPYSKLVAAGALDILSLPKLYFETQAEPLVANIADKKQLNYEWKSLEAPDPRFNYSTINWVNNTDEKYDLKGMHDVTRNLLGKEGRDGDIFMSVSTRKRLESPGELGFVIRPFDFKGGDPGVDFRDKIKADIAPNESDGYFRTFRLYKHDDNHAQDNVYRYFVNSVDNEGRLPLSNVRVNPLSTSKDILKMAIYAVPYDYSMANKNQKENLTDGVLKDDWRAFSEKWVTDFMKVVQTENLVGDLTKHISTCDGVARMAWYTPDRTRMTCLGVPLTKPLYEIDRKMLYAFSLDSMSERQQLFLYVFQAESIAPISFADMRSLAGGRAVAVVWRDPYPARDPKDRTKELVDTWYENSASGGSQGYHENKILFFKQLDN